MQLSPLSSGLPGARWTNPETYHLTLRFIGEVDRGEAEDIDAALAEVTVEPFEIMLRGLGFFGKPKAARTLWAGVDRSEPLLRLQGKIENALQRIGVPPDERKFTPHVTLAKLRSTPAAKLESFVADHSRFSAGPILVTEFMLFSSFLSSSGAIHTPEAEYALG